VSAIGPGDWVECVNNSDGHECIVSLGELRQVLDVGPCLYRGLEHLTVLFILPPGHTCPDGGRYCGSSIGRFRPIYRPKADLIESLKTPALNRGALTRPRPNALTERW